MPWKMEKSKPVGFSCIKALLLLPLFKLCLGDKDVSVLVYSLGSRARVTGGKRKSGPNTSYWVLQQGAQSWAAQGPRQDLSMSCPKNAEGKLPTTQPPAGTPHLPCSLQAPSAGDGIFPADADIADDSVCVPHEQAAGVTSLSPFLLHLCPWICTWEFVALACAMLLAGFVSYPLSERFP